MAKLTASFTAYFDGRYKTPVPVEISEFEDGRIVASCENEHISYGQVLRQLIAKYPGLTVFAHSVNRGYIVVNGRRHDTEENES